MGDGGNEEEKKEPFGLFDWDWDGDDSDEKSSQHEALGGKIGGEKTDKIGGEKAKEEEDQ